MNNPLSDGDADADGIRMGLCTIADTNSTVEDVIATAADAGYDGIEVWGRDHVGDGSPERCRAIREVADEQAVEITVYGSYLRPGTGGYADEVAHELDVAERIDVSLVRIWAGDQDYQDCTDEHWERVVADLTDLADRAADRGLGITVEKHGGAVTNREEGARRLIEAWIGRTAGSTGSRCSASPPTRCSPRRGRSYRCRTTSTSRQSRASTATGRTAVRSRRRTSTSPR